MATNAESWADPVWKRFARRLPLIELITKTGETAEGEMLARNIACAVRCVRITFLSPYEHTSTAIRKL